MGYFAGIVVIVVQPSGQVDAVTELAGLDELKTNGQQQAGSDQQRHHPAIRLSSGWRTLISISFFILHPSFVSTNSALRQPLPVAQQASRRGPKWTSLRCGPVAFTR